MGLKGIVSGQIAAPYRSAGAKTWLKIKNPDAFAMLRLKEKEA